jgi:hypothetical protein
MKKLHLIIIITIFTNNLFSQIKFGKKEGYLKYMIIDAKNHNKWDTSLIDYKFLNFGKTGTLTIKSIQNDSIFNYFYKDSLLFKINNDSTFVFQGYLSNIYNVLLIKMNVNEIENQKLSIISKENKYYKFRRMKYSKNAFLDKELVLNFRSFYRFNDIPITFDCRTYSDGNRKGVKFLFKTINSKFRLKKKYKKEIENVLSSLNFV